MKRNKKSGNHDEALKIIIMVTAILNLIASLVELIFKILDS